MGLPNLREVKIKAELFKSALPSGIRRGEGERGDLRCAFSALRFGVVRLPGAGAPG